MLRKFRTKLDSYALVVIALSAVVVAVWQVQEQRKHDRLSMMPYLDWPSEFDGKTREIKLWNKGAGVALITDCTFVINDSIFDSWERGLHYLDSTIVVNESKIFTQYKLAPNEVITLVSYQVGTVHGHVSISVEFESVYGDKDVVGYNGGL